MLHEALSWISITATRGMRLRSSRIGGKLNRIDSAIRAASSNPSRIGFELKRMAEVDAESVNALAALRPRLCKNAAYTVK